MTARPTRYAARLNSFRLGHDGTVSGRNLPTTIDLLERYASVEGLNATDLNYPDHFEGTTPSELKANLDRLSLSFNGIAMRYYTEPAFKRGAFTNHDPAIRRAAIDITRRGIEAVSEMGGSQVTLWMGQDGFDYAFQGDYRRMWDDTVSAIDEICCHNPSIDIAIEYKPNEPRSFALMPDVGTTLLAIKEVGRPNLGVTLDFAHVLYADEMPAYAASLVRRHSRILGVHLNDGYAKRDDGLIAGSVHPVQTVELLVELEHAGYDGVIYFDTFPDHSGLDPVVEASTSIAIVNRLREIASELASDHDLAAAIAGQDAARSQQIVAARLYGGTRG